MISRWFSSLLGVIFLAAAVLSGSLLHDNRGKQDEISRLQEELKSAQQDSKHWLGEYQKIKSAIDHSADDSQNQLASLQGRIRSEQQNLNPLKSKLDQIKSKTDSLSLAEIISHIQADQSSLHNLQDELKQAQNLLKGADNDIRGNAQSAKNEQKYQDAIMTGQLKSLNDTMKFAKDQIQYWQRQKLSPQRNLKIQEFQNQTQNIQTQINDLKKRKTEVDFEGQQRQNNSRNDGQSLKENLGNSEEQLKSQISQLNQDLKHWNEMQSIAQKNQSDRNQELQRLQAEFTLQQQRIDDHQLELKQKSDALRALKNSEK